MVHEVLDAAVLDGLERQTASGTRVIGVRTPSQAEGQAMRRPEHEGPVCPATLGLMRENLDPDITALRLQYTP